MVHFPVQRHETQCYHFPVRHAGYVLAGGLENPRTAVVSVPELTSFQDVNTPEEWAAYAAK